MVVALLVAVVGTSAIYAYVSRVQQKTVKSNESVQVIVATAHIPAGMTGALVAQNKLATFESVPKRNVPPGALSTLSGVADKQLSVDVYPGEVLLAAKFSERTQALTGALTIPANDLAISIQIGDPQRVAGFVVPGSQVAIFDTTGGGSGQQSSNAHTGVILPRVQVIAVGPTALKTNGSSSAGQQQTSTAILTLALTQAQAEKLVLAQSTGSLYLGLLSDKSQVTVGPGVTANQLYN
jgi:pilus assembly protein CpaB